MGVCVGLQALFEGSEENSEVPGLGIIPGRLQRFDDSDKSVPQHCWNSAKHCFRAWPRCEPDLYGMRPDSKYYYVHSYAMMYEPGVLEKAGWQVATAATAPKSSSAQSQRQRPRHQFHQRSQSSSLRVLKASSTAIASAPSLNPLSANHKRRLTRRIIACLDVRTNDKGDLVVTKATNTSTRKSRRRSVRNLGNPSRWRKIHHQGADEALSSTSPLSAKLRSKTNPCLKSCVKRLAQYRAAYHRRRHPRYKDPETNTVVPALEVASCTSNPAPTK